MPKQEKNADDIVAHVSRMEELLETLVKLQVARAMQSELADSASCKLYELTGTVPVSELASKTGFSTGKISGIWQRWEALGLIKKDGRQYRRIV